MAEIKTAMLFAAGLGTRLRPITNDIPKALVPLNGKPLLEKNILFLKSFGVERFVINIHHFANKILDFLEKKNNFGVEILISDESDCILETGGGLKKAEPMLRDEDFILMNVDILTNLKVNKMISFHFEHKNLATLAVIKRESSRKLMFDKKMELNGWKNISTGETKPKTLSKNLKPMAFSGIHILSPGIFEYLPPVSKYSIVPEYLKIAQKEQIKGFDHSGDLLLDVGKHDTLAQAEKIFN